MNREFIMKTTTVALAAGAFLCLTAPSQAEPLVTKIGIGTFIHPVQIPEAVPLPPCYSERPCRCCKEKVHIFGINGLNPLCLGNFNGLCSYVKDQGFTNTYFGQLYTSHWFAGKIREIRKNDPDARIVLIGYSLGANYVRIIANALNRDGVKVDLLVYLVGDTVKNHRSSFPGNVCRVVNVRAKGLILMGGDLFFNGAEIDNAYNYSLTCRHILVPSRRETLELMMSELLTLACVPVEAPIVPPLAKLP